jgi:hypothetical protein
VPVGDRRPISPEKTDPEHQISDICSLPSNPVPVGDRRPISPEKTDRMPPMAAIKILMADI